MTVTRETSWRDLCLKADPDFARNSRIVVEYEFSTGRRLGDERIHRSGRRIFEGDYKVRGPYSPIVTEDGGLTWNGQPLVWNGEQLTWNPEE